MKFAKTSDIKNVMKIIRMYPVLSHVDGRYIYSLIKKNNVIFDNGVVLTFKKYKRDTEYSDEYTIRKNTWHLCQIASEKQGNGEAVKILKQFLNIVDNDVVLSVRKSNKRAIKFYKNNGFKKIANIEWNDGDLKGIIMKWEYKNVV